MNGIDWAGLVTAIIAFLAAVTALIRSHLTAKTVAAVKQAVTPAHPAGKKAGGA